MNLVTSLNELSPKTIGFVRVRIS
ncbi:hypothetical protein MNV_720013 [Candidatus Methanoperedens nitroreducens]|uniref:Uncharacterized protein n=1 Tax=Candidatus Methanoperedens nitratireducens TaxID=1392998 RepID=A0A284VT32_9EURY|nr:hypothetical protein MNV_720013 [Candidatus Methanoperedens nitroreducens]